MSAFFLVWFQQSDDSEPGGQRGGPTTSEFGSHGAERNWIAIEQSSPWPPSTEVLQSINDKANDQPNVGMIMKRCTGPPQTNPNRRTKPFFVLSSVTTLSITAVFHLFNDTPKLYNTSTSSNELIQI